MIEPNPFPKLDSAIPRSAGRRCPPAASASRTADAMSIDILAMQVFNGLSLFTILLLMSLGLAIVFGLMGVINMAHGELMALGAYATLSHRAFLPAQPAVADDLVSLLPAIVVAFCVTFAFGYALERGFIRFFYNRPLDTLARHLGPQPHPAANLPLRYLAPQEVSVPLTSWLSGAWEPTPGIQLPLNRLFILGLTLAVAFGSISSCSRPRAGLRARAVTQNRAMSSAVGIDTESRGRADLRSSAPVWPASQAPCSR